MKRLKTVYLAAAVAGSSMLLAGCFSSSSSSGSKVKETDGEYSATITYTEHNVPHINADNYGSLGFGVAYAQAQENLCTLSEQLMKLRGETALYFGPEQMNIANDIGYKAMDYTAQAQELFGELSSQAQAMMKGYAAGFNQALEEMDGDYPTPCQGMPWVQPITEQDLLAYHLDLAGLASARNFLPAMAAAQPPSAQVTPMVSNIELDPTQVFTSEGIGSNGWGLGKDKVEEGNAMLIGNPHFPYDGELRFYEQHLTIPNELDITGVGLIGLPIVVIGFNDNLGWTHTVSQSKRFTLYQLELDPEDPTRYMFDGESRAMTTKEVTVLVNIGQPEPMEHKQTVYFTHFGPVVNLGSMSPALAWSETSAVAFRDATDGNYRMLEQWLAMGKAKDRKGFFAAFNQHQALPWVNTIMIDKEGTASYLDGTQVPMLSAPAETYWRMASQDPQLAGIWQDGAGNVLLPGNSSTYEWVDTGRAGAPGLVPFAHAPQTTRTDYVFNANSSYSMLNVDEPLKGYSFMFGPDNSIISPRSRYNAQLVHGIADNSIDVDGGNGLFTFAELKDALNHNGSLFGNSFKEELVQRCVANSSITIQGNTVDLTPACGTLAAWDGRYNLDSEGAFLMREFLDHFRHPFHRGLDHSLFAVPFDPANPATTPAGLAPLTGEADDDPILQALASAMGRLMANGIAPNARLADHQYIVKAEGHEPIPVTGGNSYEGVFNMSETAIPTRSTSRLATVVTGEKNICSEVSGLCSPLTTKDGEAAYRINYGSSFVMALMYGDNGPKAEMLLSYSQSHDPASEFFDDQTKKYGQLEWRDMVFSPEAVAANKVREVKVSNQ